MMKYLSTSLWTLVSTITLLGFSVGTQADLVVLQYHHIANDSPAVTSISPDRFAKHMALLEQENMTVVDLNDAVRTVLAGEKLPERAVAITFDDAYLSIYENAWPLLKERKWPFTVFVNTQAVDEGHTVAMSWDQLRELDRHGVRIANHSVGHPYLLEPPQGMDNNDWLTQQISQAEQRIESEIGHSPRLFAYPYGEYNLAIAAWLKDNSYIAFGQQSGAIGSTSHPQILPRYPASGVYANIDTLRTKLHSLALPVPAEQVLNPILQDENPPTLSITFNRDDITPNLVQCYASGEGEVAVRRQEKNPLLSLTVQAQNAITAGRSRYNCTAPSRSQHGRFYWYSQLWINMAVANR
ncbi:MAG: peptidoglycan/xylan/chitin deacetylase (PgdA/CDA1 family) [Thalassolituus oleivorans]|jgi:peptidoglycan/xylan/chitin deacetylase (PgdA/CDA1 family)